MITAPDAEEMEELIDIIAELEALEILKQKYYQEFVHLKLQALKKILGEEHVNGSIQKIHR